MQQAQSLTARALLIGKLRCLACLIGMYGDYAIKFRANRCKTQ
jgi:hypothetical protein